jgi:hypothetical protein
VSGADAAALETTVESYRGRSDLTWRHTAPGLEDAFIHFMRNAQDNFQ